MSKINFLRVSLIFLLLSLLAACQPLDFANIKPNFSKIKEVPSALLNVEKSRETASSNSDNPLPLKFILEDSLAEKNQGSDFATSLKYALDTDPNIMSLRLDLEASSAAVRATQAQKDFQVGTTLYGGIEDVTDNTKGLAVALNASRLVYDGGKLDSRINSSIFELESAKMELRATLDQRANELCQKWLELEKYKSLQAQIDRRLAVLDPLIDQLEKVAKAGVGDVSKVTAAQRTVSAIRVQKTSIAEGLAQAQLEFLNLFGVLESGVAFDYEFITNLVPAEISDSLVQRSPLLMSQYASYQASIENIRSLKAKAGFDVGFEVSAMRPFAGSEYDSDESIGLVGRKTLYNGGMLDAEIKEAEALAEARLAKIRATYRTGARSVQAAIQNIESMDKAILIARENAKLTSDEIVHLRQQLIIGGSTLERVLSAEARLYEAESKEIQFRTEKYKSKVVIISSLGLLSNSIGF